MPRAGKRFACGAAVVDALVPGTEEIAVQGDFVMDMAEYIAAQLKEVHTHKVYTIVSVL